MNPRSLRTGLTALAFALCLPAAALAADIVETAKADGHFTMLLKASTVSAMSGVPLVITREGGVLTVNGPHVIKGPMKVDNGMVYVIDAVLIPPMPIQPRL